MAKESWKRHRGKVHGWHHLNFPPHGVSPAGQLSSARGESRRANFPPHGVSPAGQFSSARGESRRASTPRSRPYPRAAELQRRLPERARALQGPDCKCDLAIAPLLELGVCSDRFLPTRVAPNLGHHCGRIHPSTSALSSRPARLWPRAAQEGGPKGRPPEYKQELSAMAETGEQAPPRAAS